VISLEPHLFPPLSQRGGKRRDFLKSSIDIASLWDSIAVITILFNLDIDDTSFKA